MRAAIRVDASLEIGTGHLMRCMTLARQLRANGADVRFICREEDGHLCDVIEGDCFDCSRLPQYRAQHGFGSTAHGAAEFCEADARLSRVALESGGPKPDLLVVDHYMLDRRWESCLRASARRIFVIDDLANRPHDCDLLLDQNLHDSPQSRYAGLVLENTKMFLGPRYALLRPEFDAAAAVPRTNGLRRMLIFFGGVDPTNEALKTVMALRSLGPAAPEAVIVLGPINPHSQSVAAAAHGMARVNVLGRTDDMARLMREADLGVGTCGVAAWERCRVGLPSLVVVSADNQRDDARILQALGAARSLGDAVDTGSEEWASAIRDMSSHPASLTSMSIAAAAVMRGRSEAMGDLEAALVS